MRTIKGTLEHGRFRVPYRCYGEHDDVLLCVSGALQTMAVWHSVARRFQRHFTVVVFDMPGVGRSEILEGSAHVSLREQLDVLSALVEETAQGGRLTLAGSSWGTVVAVAHAAQHPAAVDQLVLSSFGMKPNACLEDLIGRARALYHAGELSAGADLILEVFGQQVGESYRRQIIAQFRQLDRTVADSCYEHASSILSLGDLRDAVDLTAIRARTLIVNGAEDRIIDVDDMWEAQALIPDCECLLVPGVGHFLHFERPELLDDYEAFMVPETACAAG